MTPLYKIQKSFNMTQVEIMDNNEKYQDLSMDNDIYEIMKYQPVVNVGMIGHVMNGKTTITKCLSGKATQKFEKEKERNITIRIGYANAKIWLCHICDAPESYSSSDSSLMEKRCKYCNSDLELVNHISIVDCFDPKTKALMFDGSAKEMSDLKCGELLMGPDGKSRQILSMCEGEKNMYEIKYKKRSKKSLDTNGFICTGGHLLVLRIDTPINPPCKHKDQYKVSFFTVTNSVVGMKTLLFSNFQDAQNYYTKQSKDAIVFEITVENYINLSSYLKSKMRLFYSPCLEFEETKNTRDLSILDASKEEIAWLIGLWLADGSSDGPRFTLGTNENEQEIIDKINVICKKINLVAIIKKYSNKNAYWINLSIEDYPLGSTQSGIRTYKDERCNDNSKNPFTLLLKDLNLLNNKQIDKELMFQSVSVRQALLAGFIDGNGSYGKGQYEIVQSENHKNLIYGLQWICKSIGFRSHMARKNTKVIVDDESKEYLQYRLNFNGNALDLPIASPQKKGKNIERSWISSQPFDIIPMNMNKYIGFEVDRDGRFLLGDFIVAHNCPGHSELIATMLNGSCVMDHAILIESCANEIIPGAQTAEHFFATLLAKIPTAMIIMNKIDAVNKKIALEKITSISSFIETKMNSCPPIVPVSATFGTNIDVMCQYLSKLKSRKNVNELSIFKMNVIRSFDINKPGIDLLKLNGGVIGGTVMRGSLKVGDAINIYPGMVRKIPQNEKKENGADFRYEPIRGECLSIQSESNNLTQVFPGGLLAIQLTIDPSFSRNDMLSGSMVLKKTDVESNATSPDKLFKIYDKIIVKLTSFLIDKKELIVLFDNFTELTKGQNERPQLMININSNNIDCRVKKYFKKTNELMLYLSRPISIDTHDNIGIILNKNISKDILTCGIIVDGIECESLI